MHKPTAARGSVLVVDDERGLRDLLAWELARHGYEIETADNGLSAVAALRRRRFDLAITDFNMPGMDGAETVSALRAIDPDIEVIVATGYASVETAVSCMKRGAFDYIQKPYDLDELRMLLERALQKVHLQGLVDLYEASRALLITLRRGEVEPLVLELAQKLLRAETICLAITEGRASSGQAGSRTASPELVEQLVAHRGSPSPIVVAPDVRVPRLGEEGFRTALVQPLCVRGTTLGHLAVLRAGDAFSVGDLRRCSVFGAQVALALHNSRLCDALSERVQDLLRTRENLAQAEKHNLDGRLATNLAHDLGRPLAQARGVVESINEDICVLHALVAAARDTAEHLEAEGTLPGVVLARTLRNATQSRKGLTDAAADAEQAIHEMARGVGQMARVVSRFQRMTRGTAAFERGPIAASTALQQCVEDLQTTHGQDVARFSIEGDADLFALAVRDDLFAALGHVLELVVASDTGDARSIRVTSSGAQVSIAVTDPTLALRPEERMALLEGRPGLRSIRGRRFDDGLQLARRLLSRNGGDLVLDRDGSGTCIRVLLERAPDPVQRAS